MSTASRAGAAESPPLVPAPCAEAERPDSESTGRYCRRASRRVSRLSGRSATICRIPSRSKHCTHQTHLRLAMRRSTFRCGTTDRTRGSTLAPHLSISSRGRGRLVTPRSVAARRSASRCGSWPRSVSLPESSSASRVVTPRAGVPKPFFPHRRPEAMRLTRLAAGTNLARRSPRPTERFGSRSVSILHRS